MRKLIQNMYVGFAMLYTNELHMPELTSTMLLLLLNLVIFCDSYSTHFKLFQFTNQAFSKKKFTNQALKMCHVTCVIEMA